MVWIKYLLVLICFVCFFFFLIFTFLPSFFLEKAMATHSSTLAWKMPWTEDSGRLQSMGLLRVGHNWAISLSRIGEGNGSPLQYSCLENPREGGGWWAAVYGVAQSRTRLKRLSSGSSCHLFTKVTWGKSHWDYFPVSKMEENMSVC